MRGAKKQRRRMNGLQQCRDGGLEWLVRFAKEGGVLV
jgi:hypothetical protein